MRRRVRVGAKARARIRAGGPTSVHRKALPRKEWVALREYVYKREGFACWWCQDWKDLPLDPHHVQKRSAGGADSKDNVLALGRACHNHTDAAYSSRRGRLVIRALGGERFIGAVVQAPDKATGQAREAQLLRMAEQALQG